MLPRCRTDSLHELLHQAVFRNTSPFDAVAVSAAALLDDCDDAAVTVQVGAADVIADRPLLPGDAVSVAACFRGLSTLDTDLVHGKLQLAFAVGRRGTVAPPVSSRRMLLSPFTSLCTTSAAVAVPISAPSGVIRVQTRASAPSFGMGCVLQDTSLRVCYRVASRGYEGTLLVSAGAEQQHDWRVTSDTSRKQHVQVRVMAGDDAPTPSHFHRTCRVVDCVVAATGRCQRC